MTFWKNWLRRVLLSKAMNFFRERERHPTAPLDSVVGTAQEPCGSPEESATPTTRQSLAERMWSAVQELASDADDLNVRLTVLRYLDGKSTAQIAAATGLSPDQIRDRLRRIRNRLRRRLLVNKKTHGGGGNASRQPEDDP